jgi:hypothetical protein
MHGLRTASFVFVASLLAACGGEEPVEEPSQPPAPVILNAGFDSISNGIPADWSTDCGWDFIMLAGPYGETGGGAVRMLGQDCFLSATRAAPVAIGAGTYAVSVRYKVDSTGMPACVGCARLEAQWLVPDGGVWNDGVVLPNTSGAWTTVTLVTVKPATARGFRIVMQRQGTTTDAVTVDAFSVEPTPAVP